MPYDGSFVKTLWRYNAQVLFEHTDTHSACKHPRVPTIQMTSPLLRVLRIGAGITGFAYGSQRLAYLKAADAKKAAAAAAAAASTTAAAAHTSAPAKH